MTPTDQDIRYVDHDPLIPGHLHTDAPHVHARPSDRCLRNDTGQECLTAEQMRERLAAVRALAEKWGDRRRSDGMSGNAWIGTTLAAVSGDLLSVLDGSDR